MPTIIFDFDSSLISCESLEKLQEKHYTAENGMLEKVSSLTNQGMSGEIPFSESLRSRLELLPPHKEEVLSFAKEAINYLTEEIADCIKSLQKEHQCEIWIISGGLQEILQVVGEELGISADRIHGVQLLWNEDGTYQGIDPNDPFSISKYLGAKTLSPLWSGPKIMIGDGMTDYELYAKNLTDHFIAFTEHIARPALLAKNCLEAKNVFQLQRIIKECLCE